MVNLLESSEKDIFDYQIDRLQVLKDVPTDLSEHIRVARTYAPCGACGRSLVGHSADGAPCHLFDSSVLCAIVSRLIEDCVTCPSPSVIKDALFANRPTEPDPAWLHAPTPSGSFGNFIETNKDIMDHANAREQSDKIKRDRVKHFLGVHDFMDVVWPQRFWAEQQLGYELTDYQQREVRSWLTVTSCPKRVIKNSSKTGEQELAAMFSFRHKRDKRG